MDPQMADAHMSASDAQTPAPYTCTGAGNSRSPNASCRQVSHAGRPSHHPPSCCLQPYALLADHIG